ncbi:MAG TPA: hypothetical protein VED17_05515 [Nitrososphaerales archaeon]|nr:hypothetical protein [Nitrososphaerales archaeon]
MKSQDESTDFRQARSYLPKRKSIFPIWEKGSPVFARAAIFSIILTVFFDVVSNFSNKRKRFSLGVFEIPINKLLLHLGKLRDRQNVCDRATHRYHRLAPLIISGVSMIGTLRERSRARAPPFSFMASITLGFRQ